MLPCDAVGGKVWLAGFTLALILPQLAGWWVGGNWQVIKLGGGLTGNQSVVFGVFQCTVVLQTLFMAMHSFRKSGSRHRWEILNLSYILITSSYTITGCHWVPLMHSTNFFFFLACWSCLEMTCYVIDLFSIGIGQCALQWHDVHGVWCLSL